MHITSPSQIKLRGKRVLVKPLPKEKTAGGIIVPEELQDKGEDIVWEIVGKSPEAELAVGTRIFVSYEATIRPANLKVTTLRINGVPHAALPEEYVVAVAEGV